VIEPELASERNNPTPFIISPAQKDCYDS